MAGEVFIADKETLDSIKVDTTAILADCGEKKIVALNNYYAPDGGTADVWATLIDVNNTSGFLIKAIMSATGNNGFGKGLRVTIDGNIVCEIILGSTGTGTTVYTHGIYTDGIPILCTIPTSGIVIRNFPFIDGNAVKSNGNNIILSKPLVFKQSLKIEYRGTISGSSSISCNATYALT